jgi:uncharacterized protein YdhG (YjbR/CyaY superfamily)
VSAKAAGPGEVDGYINALPSAERVSLGSLRETIKRIAPTATETISYQMPAFKDRGRFLVSYAAFKDHCSLFPASERVKEVCGDELTPYLSGKGTIRFDPTEPLPARLVEKIVKARLEENDEARSRGRA